MPTYVYRCKKGHRFELFHSITDETVKRCPRCKAKAERVPAGGAGILFKGSGFYITDYRSSSYREGASKEKPGTGSSTGGSKSGEAGGSGSSGGSGASEGKGTSTAKGSQSSAGSSGSSDSRRRSRGGGASGGGASGTSGGN